MSSVMVRTEAEQITVGAHDVSMAPRQSLYFGEDGEIVTNTLPGERYRMFLSTLPSRGYHVQQLELDEGVYWDGDWVTLGTSGSYVHLYRDFTGSPNSYPELYLTNPTANSITFTISKIVRLDITVDVEGTFNDQFDDVFSQITQLNNQINLRVQKNNIVHQLNISTEGILIGSAKKQDKHHSHNYTHRERYYKVSTYCRPSNY